MISCASCSAPILCPSSVSQLRVLVKPIGSGSFWHHCSIPYCSAQVVGCSLPGVVAEHEASLGLGYLLKVIRARCHASG